MADACCIVLAAGSSRRMGENKMLLRIGGKFVLERTLDALNSYFKHIIIVCKKKDMPLFQPIANKTLSIPFTFVEGGSKRQFSVKNALPAAKEFEIVAVHDGARCFVSSGAIQNCIARAAETGAAAVGVRVKDTIKLLDKDIITKTIDRRNVVNIQTPQAFRYALLKAAHDKADTDGFVGTDECVLLERMGIPVSFVESDWHNIKITAPEDVLHAKYIAGEQPRTGYGYDAHKLARDRKLILGGVNVPHSHGLLGHSDADVLVHAIIDALLGAAAAGDIGAHFPCTQEHYCISSLLLLERTKEILDNIGCSIANIDATVVAQLPKLSPYIEQMRKNIATALQIDVKLVSVKTTTTEGMGFEGAGEGISSHAVATILA